MMDIAKSIGASILTVISWIGAISVQDTITFVLASVLTVATIIFVILGIRNRAIEHKIKRQQLNELQNEG